MTPPQHKDGMEERFKKLNPLNELTMMQWDFANANGTITLSPVDARIYADQELKAIGDAESKVINFIQSEITLAVKEALERQIKEIESMKVVEYPETDERYSQWDFAHNIEIDAVLSRLASLSNQ